MIIPAFLETTTAALRKRFSQVESLRYHIDVMDGSFTPRRTVGAAGLKAIKPNAFIEAHLMVKDPLKKMPAFVGAIDMVIVHVETLDDVDDYIRNAKRCGLLVGVAIDPETPLRKISPYAQWLDRVLIMTVHPGKQGQKFDKKALAKVRLLRKRFPHLSIGVDGGIHHGTVRMAAKAGADALVVGSAIVHADNPMKAFKELQAEERGA